MKINMLGKILLIMMSFVFVGSCSKSSEAPPEMIGGKVQAALFVGERIEYQVEADSQGLIFIYGERHEPIEDMWYPMICSGSVR